LPAAAIVRVIGPGADLLYGCEGGLHRFHGLAGEPSHVWVELLEPRGDLTDEQWGALPGPPAPRAPSGKPMREVLDERLVIEGDEIDLAWADLPARLEEASVVRILHALAKPDALEAMWAWQHPLQALAAVAAAQAAEDDA